MPKASVGFIGSRPQSSLLGVPFVLKLHLAGFQYTEYADEKYMGKFA